MRKKYFHKTLRLLRELLRRDCLKLLIWVISLTFFSGGFAEAMNQIYGKDKVGLMGLYETLKNPAMVSLCGPTPVKQAADYTIGAMYAQEMILFTAILFAILSILHVISRTRKEEDEGKLELIRAFQIGRLSNSTAVVIELFITHLLITVGIIVLILAQQVPSMLHLEDICIFALSLTSQGFLWGIIALFVTQLSSNASGGKMFSILFYALLYIARMATDMKQISWSWFNPVSWCYLTFPFVKNDWVPIVLSFGISIVFLSFAFILESKRDMNGGYFPERVGKRVASPVLLSIGGFVFHLNRGFLLMWCTSLFLGGAIYGSIFGDMSKFVEGNAIVKEMFLHNTKFTLQEQFMSVIFMVLATLTSVLAMSMMLKINTEEKRSRLDQLYATRISKGKLFLTYLIYSLIAGVFGQLCVSLGLYIAQSATMQHAISFGEVLQSGMIWLPAIAFLIGLTAMFVAILPKASSIVWGYLTTFFFISYFGQLIDIPKWVEKLNVFSHIPKIPVEKMNVVGVSTVSLIAISMIIAAFFAYRRRDLN